MRREVGMAMYLRPQDQRTEMERNALLLYPYINNKTISHGKAAEILGISKYDLIELYDQMGLAYLSMDIAEIEDEVANWEKLKENTHAGIRQINQAINRSKISKCR